MVTSDPSSLQAAFSALAGLLGTPEGRDQVRAGTYHDALQAEGVDPSGIPASLLETLAGMSDEEMAMVSQIQGRISGAFPEPTEDCIIF